MTQWDCVSQMQYKYQDISKTDEKDADKTSEWREYVEQCKDSFPFKGGTFNTFGAMAKLPKEIWAKLKAIFSGQVVPNKRLKQNTPKNFSPFQKMGNIPDSKSLKWLDHVVEGRENCKEFVQRCETYKKRIRVRADIVDHINIIKPTMNFNSYTKMCETYERFADATFFDMIYSCCGGLAKDEFPTHAKELVERCLKEYDQLQDERKLTEVYIYI